MPPTAPTAPKSPAAAAASATNPNPPAPTGSPAASAAVTTPAEVSVKQRELRNLVAKRLPRTVAQIKTMTGLAKFKPTQTQRDFMLKQLKDAVAEVEKAFAGIAPEAVAFDFPD